MAKSAKKTTSKNDSQSSEETLTMQKDPKLQDLFVEELKDIYWAEKHLVKTLPKMQKAASTSELKQALTEHLEATKQHVTRLEQVFELMGKKVQGKKCEAMEGLAKEGQGLIDDTESGTATRDVGIILASQKIEHYEIATYGGLIQLAKTLGFVEVAEILATTLKEEKNADELLTIIAEKSINYQAAGE